MSKIIELHSKEANKEELPEIVEILTYRGWEKVPEKSNSRINKGEIKEEMENADKIFKIDEETIAFVSSHSNFANRIVKIKK